MILSHGQCFSMRELTAFCPQLDHLAMFLLSLLLRGLGRESKNSILCCGEGFIVSGKTEPMGFILKDRMWCFPLVLFAFPPPHL